MPDIQLTVSTVRKILTRTTGFLTSVCSHSLQPYRGCTFGASLCGVGCYVQHNRWLTRGQPWGSFLEARTNAADSYVADYAAEQRWARMHRGAFGVFMSSSTDPFVPHETRYGVTRAVIEAMIAHPPDVLIIQTHTHLVTRYLERYAALKHVCDLRFHLSIESDRDTLPGLPPPASAVDRRFDAARQLRAAGHRVIITVAPLLPIRDPPAFFQRIADSADGVVVDHFIEGDGTPDGRRTQSTPLAAAMARVDPDSVTLGYRDRMVDVARAWMPGRVGVSIDGFAGRWLG